MDYRNKDDIDQETTPGLAFRDEKTGISLEINLCSPAYNRIVASVWGRGLKR